MIVKTSGLSLARKALQFGVALLPASRLKNSCLNKLGFDIHHTARIGPIICQRVGMLTMEKGASIGPFNVLRDLTAVSLGSGSVLGQWNWISASPPLVAVGGAGSLLVGDQSAITSRHYIDASGGVTIGKFTTVAGVRTTFITHGIDWRTTTQRVRSISIGDYCLIASNNSIVPGAQLGDGVVTGMGSVIGGDIANHTLNYASRAATVAHVQGSYFTRKSGFVRPKQTD